MTFHLSDDQIGKFLTSLLSIHINPFDT